jgi:hypothetical protein
MVITVGEEVRKDTLPNNRGIVSIQKFGWEELNRLADGYKNTQADPLRGPDFERSRQSAELVANLGEFLDRCENQGYTATFLYVALGFVGRYESMFAHPSNATPLIFDHPISLRTVDLTGPGYAVRDQEGSIVGRHCCALSQGSLGGQVFVVALAENE